MPCQVSSVGTDRGAAGGLLHFDRERAERSPGYLMLSVPFLRHSSTLGQICSLLQGFLPELAPKWSVHIS